MSISIYFSSVHSRAFTFFFFKKKRHTRIRLVTWGSEFAFPIRQLQINGAPLTGGFMSGGASGDGFAVRPQKWKSGGEGKGVKFGGRRINKKKKKRKKYHCVVKER